MALNINDVKYQFLASEGFTGALNDMEYEYYKTLFTPTNTLTFSDLRKLFLDITVESEEWQDELDYWQNPVGGTPSGPPVNIYAPAIEGTFEQFQTLTIDVGLWSGALPITYTYQWKKDGDDVVDATESTYALTYLDVGSTFTCEVTATNIEGSTMVETAETPVIDINNPALPATPSMIFAFEPGDSSSEYITFDQNFTSADVDTLNNKLLFGDIGFPEYDGVFADFKGSPIFFETDGTLPAPLVAGDAYYLSPASGGGYHIYPEMDETHWENLPTGIEFESPMPAQNYIEQANVVVLTTGGTGTHRIYSEPLVNRIYDRLGSGCTIENRNAVSNDRHSALRIQIDANGRHLVSREICRDARANEGGTYNLYGPSPIQGGISKSAARSASANRRAVWVTVVTRTIFRNNRSVKKNILDTTDINTTTGVISYSNLSGRFSSGTLVRWKTPTSGNVLPDGFDDVTDYYVRSAGDTYTLHPTAADATNNTNVVIPSDVGTGKFVLWGPRTIGDFHRQAFWIEWLEPNGGANTLSPYPVYQGPTSRGLLSGSSITITDGGGLHTGDINGIGLYGDLTRIELFFAPEAIRPIRQDTGLELEDGFYYVTQRSGGGGTYGRLHDTLEKAEACVGVATSSASNTDMIKYNSGTTPNGDFLTVWATGSCPIVLNADWTTTAADPTGGIESYDTFGVDAVPLDTDVHTMTLLIDNNDPDETYPIAKFYKDGVLQIRVELDGTKGNTDSNWTASQPAWTWLNSAALHVPFCGDMYATYLGATTDTAVTDDEILALHQYTFDKYAVVQGPPVPLIPSNTVLPAISGTLQTGQILSCSDGTWNEYPIGTKTYQWTRDGVDISGATNNTYLLIAADADTLIGCEVTSTNASGAVTAVAADVGPIVGVPAAPSLAVAGSIDGNINEGFVLTYTPAIWNGYPAPTIGYQWRRDGVNISGATSITYTTVADDADTLITCYETANNASGSANTTSNSLGPIIAAPAYESEATTLFGRMSPAPDASLKLHANTLIKALKDAGVWSKLDMFQVYAVPEAQYSLLDWKDSSRTASLVTAGSGPTFTADRGYRGTVSVADYISTGWNPVGAGGNYSQNSAHLGIFPTDDATSVISQSAADIGFQRAYIQTKTQSSGYGGVLNATSSSFSVTGITTAIGHFVTSRSASTTIDVYRDGAAEITGWSQTSASPTNAVCRVCTREGSSNYSTKQIGVAHGGGALTAQNVEDLYAAIWAYLDSRGVPNLPPFEPPAPTDALAIGSETLLVDTEELTLS